MEGSLKRGVLRNAVTKVFCIFFTNVQQTKMIANTNI